MPLLTTFSSGSAKRFGLASGGPTIVTGYNAVNYYGGYVAFKFTSTGTMGLTGEAIGDILLVSGGQGGYYGSFYYCFKDCGYAYGGGNGGAGSLLLTQTNYTLPAGNYTMTVGAGGTGGVYAGAGPTAGGVSSIVGGAITLVGPGSSYPTYAYGGNVTAIGLASYGGGPGAGGSGGNAVDGSNPGVGGIGATNNYWNGTSIYYGGGGGGGTTNGPTVVGGGTGGGGNTGSNGAANTGGGGGAAAGNPGTTAANGGSGIIIIRFDATKVIAG